MQTSDLTSCWNWTWSAMFTMNIQSPKGIECKNGLRMDTVLTLTVDGGPGHDEAGQGGAQLVRVRCLSPLSLLLRAELGGRRLGRSLSPLPPEALALLQSAGGHLLGVSTQTQLPPPPLNL